MEKEKGSGGTQALQAELVPSLGAEMIGNDEDGERDQRENERQEEIFF